MSNIRILKIYPKSFVVNVYSTNPFRMIGLIDVSIKYYNDIERVTLPFYMSSGTNNGKIKGLWYPIVGIKLYSGEFNEFTEDINSILTKCTMGGRAKRGWIVKSLFFIKYKDDYLRTRGFSGGRHYNKLFEIGKELRYLYKKERFIKVDKLDGKILDYIVTLNRIYKGNHHTQRENFENFMEDIFMKN